MFPKKINRRSFVKAAITAGVASGVAGGTRLQASSPPKKGENAYPLRLGGPIQLPKDPEEMARAYRAVGYRAAYCPNVSSEDTDRIRSISRAFKKHDVVLAEVGRWVNLMDADPAKRKANMAKVTDGLALAEAIDAKCCVDIAGSFSKESWFGPHPENLSKDFFDLAVENARKIVDAVKPRRAKFCYEMMGWALPDSPDAYLKMIKAVDRPGFAVHLDPCNLVNSPKRFYGNAALIDECFDKLGPWIVSCHAKDLTWDVEMNVHFREVRPGTGSVDYKTYLRRLAQLPESPPLMLEHLPNLKEYDTARDHILKLGKSMGLRF